MRTGLAQTQELDTRSVARGHWHVAWQLLSSPLGLFGASLIFGICALAALAPLIAPSNPNTIRDASTFSPPSREFLLGTDELGRDVLSRIIWGSRVALVVGIGSVAAGTTIGSLLGLLSGYFGRTFDTVVQRLVDTILAFPLLVLALTLVAMLGASVGNIIISVSVVLVPQAARVIRSAALVTRSAQFIDASRAIGCSSGRILLYHILPQCMAPYLIIATSAVGWAVIVDASLSFLGAGPPPSVPTWGDMLSSGARLYVQYAPWMVVFPGVAISLTVFGFNLLGDALRDVLDPRLRR